MIRSGSGMPAVARKPANTSSSSVVGVEPPGQRRLGGGAGGGGDLGARAVGQRDRQVQPRIAPRCRAPRAARSVWISGSNRLRSPMKRSRTPLAFSSAISVRR